MDCLSFFNPSNNKVPLAVMKSDIYQHHIIVHRDDRMGWRHIDRLI